MVVKNLDKNRLIADHLETITRTIPSKQSFKKLNSYIPVDYTKRNPAWLSMPSVTSSDQKFVALQAVYAQGSNFATIKATVSAGSFTVDWGDGVVETYDAASSNTAYHDYNYNNATLNNTDGPVVFTAANSTVTRTSHGYSNNDIVYFSSINTTTGPTVDTPYYVLVTGTDSFQLSNTSSGSAVTLTNDGTGSLLPYKQAIITVTPTTANLTDLDISARYNLPTNLYSASTVYTSSFLDIILSMPNATSGAITIGTFASGATSHRYVEFCTILNIGQKSSMSNFFYTFRSLKKLTMDFSVTANVNSMNSMFESCYSLQSVPLFDTANVTSMSSMFSGCYNLQSVPLFDTRSVTAMNSMFYLCSRLITVPLFNTRAVTNMSGMFQTCYNLQSVPLFNTSKVTDMSLMFNSCYSLQSVPLFDTRAVTTMSSMFNGCFTLQSVPLFNTSKVTDMGSMFSSCFTLQSVPLFDTANVTSMSSMFNSCYSLQSVPLFNTAKVTAMNSMFSSCYSLQSVPLFNTRAVIAMNSMFSLCYSLQTVPLFDTANVTNMFGMFSSCYSLQSVPLFNTAKVTDMSSMFNNCSTLQTVPLFNTANVTTMFSMFTSCYSLQSVPLFDTAKVTSFQSAFNGCHSLQSLPLFNTANTTTFNGFLSLCLSLRSVPSFDTRAATDITNFMSTTPNIKEIKNLNFQNVSVGATVSFVSPQLIRSGVSNLYLQHSYGGSRLSANSLGEIFYNLPPLRGTSNSISIVLTPGVGNVYTVSATVAAGGANTTAGSNVVISTNTAFLTSARVGSLVRGSGISNNYPVSFVASNSTVIRVGHGLTTNTNVAFRSITTTTGILTNTIYKVINTGTDSFQVSNNGVTAITLTNDGTGQIVWPNYIVSVNPGVSFTMIYPAQESLTTQQYIMRDLDTSQAILKNWSIIG